MNKIKQNGIAQILIILTIVTLVIVGASIYMIFRSPSKNTARTSTETVLSKKDTEPNGTADNAVNAAESQLSAELASENGALDDEDNATQIDSSLINEIEATANEENL